MKKMKIIAALFIFLPKRCWYWIYIKGNKSKILGSYATKSMVYTSSVNKSDKAEFGHPTCKPVDLMEKFIINHTDVQCVV